MTARIIRADALRVGDRITNNDMYAEVLNVHRAGEHYFFIIRYDDGTQQRIQCRPVTEVNRYLEAE